MNDQWYTLFYRDRRLLSLTICLILVAGSAALVTLPRMEDPVLTQRAAIINTRFPGASAERVETLVTDVLEEEIQEIEDIKELRSVSRDSISTITIELQDTVGPREADTLWSRIRDKLADAEPALPPGASAPQFDKLNITAYALIVALEWDGPGEPRYAILRRQAEELADQLRAVTGTKEVDLFGAPEEEILVTVRQDELTERRLTVADVTAQLTASDAKVSAGRHRNDAHDLPIEISDELDSLARVRRTPIQVGITGQSLALGDVADVRRTVRTPLSSKAIVAGKPAVAVAAMVSPEQRVDLWFHDVRDTLGAFQDTLPTGVTQEIRFEQDTYVRGRLTSLSWNLCLGAIAVVAVIGLLMGWRSAVVVGISLPLASLMVLAGLNGLGIPLHQMSITGLIIALGLLIDNAIVIVDEVAQEMAHAVPPVKAVRKAVGHLAIPLFGSTMTTTLSFAPIALMPGPAGEFVGSIAISVILAVISSFLLAMTVTPAIAALLLPSAATRRQADGWLAQGIRIPAFQGPYLRALTFIYRKPIWGVLLSVLLPICGFALGTTLTEQFFPPADRDQVNVQLELPASASLEQTEQVARAARELMLAHENVTAVDWYLGQSAPSFYYNMLANRSGVASYGQALVQLRSADQARNDIHQLQMQLNESFPQARFLVRQLEQGPPFEAPIEIRVVGPDLDQLRVLGNDVRRVLSQTPQVVHATTDLGESRPTLALDVDEEVARRAGLTQMDLANQLEAALEGRVGGQVLESTEELPVRVRSDDAARGDLGQITSQQLVASAAGAPSIPLASVAQMTLVPKVPAIRRFDTQRINEVRAYTRAGTLPAEVLEDFSQRWQQAGISLPPGYELVYAGEASKRDEAVGNLMSQVGVLAVLMVATLVLSFSSYRMALIVGGVAFLSVGLSLGALAVFGFPFGFMAIVGTMGLIGVAINDTIVVLAAIREDDQAREGNPQAIANVVLRSTRHVLATTFTTIAGFLPLVAAGGGFWPPLATAIAGGVSGATVLALLFGPSCYVMLMGRPRSAPCRRVHADQQVLTRPASVPAA